VDDNPKKLITGANIPIEVQLVNLSIYHACLDNIKRPYTIYSMRTLSIPYPDTLPDAAHLSDTDFRREARTAMAVKMFELGKLTTGQAASLAGISRASFIMTLSIQGVHAIAWDEDECDQEFRNA
jgi:predicted HTH domain antitoxin